MDGKKPQSRPLSRFERKPKASPFSIKHRIVDMLVPRWGNGHERGRYDHIFPLPRLAFTRRWLDLEVAARLDLRHQVIRAFLEGGDARAAGGSLVGKELQGKVRRGRIAPKVPGEHHEIRGYGSRHRVVIRSSKAPQGTLGFFT